MLAVEFSPGLAGRLALFDDAEVVAVLPAKLRRGLLMQFGEGAPRGRGPDQGLVTEYGNVYLKDRFPKLDFIKSASIVE